MGESTLRIRVINPNSNEAVTRGLDAALEPLRFADGPKIVCSTLPDGPFGIETQADVESVVMPLRRMVEADNSSDASSKMLRHAYRKRVQAFDANGFFCLKRNQGHAQRKQFFDFTNLRNLGSRTSSQYRVARLSRCKTAVDDPCERLDLRPAQVVLQCACFKHRCRLRQGERPRR